MDKTPVALLGGRRGANHRLAGVTPQFVECDGPDPAANVVAENIRRRHLSKGQQAIALARVYAPDGTWERGEQKAVVATANAPGQTYLNRAAFVVAHAPDLADAVAAGTTGLLEAYEAARQRAQDGGPRG